MNSGWKGNPKIIVMTLVPTHSEGRIKIGFLGAPKSQLQVKVDKNLQQARV